ncbi:MAG: hypothetical protein OXG44_19835, partial [Gammaproteobacteria bacterium]|nr:hypothetical protein [Gammaproteobacteria bacterium]
MFFSFEQSPLATLSRPLGRIVARIGKCGFAETGRDMPVPYVSMISLLPAELGDHREDAETGAENAA